MLLKLISVALIAVGVAGLLFLLAAVVDDRIRRRRASKLPSATPHAACLTRESRQLRIVARQAKTIETLERALEHGAADLTRMIQERDGLRSALERTIEERRQLAVACEGYERRLRQKGFA